MQIIIKETTLEVISAGAKRLPSGKVLVIIEVKQELISHDDLRALFKDATEDLVVTRDDGTKETYGGCHYAIKVSDDTKKQIVDGVETEVEIHKAEIECNSEAEFQIGRMRGTVQAHAEAIVKQTEASKNIATAVSAHTETLKAQQNSVDGLEITSASTLAAIDTILTEVLPKVITEMVASATQAVLVQVEERLSGAEPEIDYTDERYEE